VLAARLARVPIVIHGEHGREASDPHGLDRKRNRIRRAIAPLVNRFVAVSEDLGRWLVDVVHVPPKKVVVIHNGVDVGRFAGDGRERARRALDLADDRLVLGTIGRLDPVKDHVGLVEAFADVAPTCPSATLLIVGEGPCRAAIAGAVKAHALDARVRLLGERHDVPQLLTAFDVYVLSSIAEGISNTILEAMASGLPVLATRTGGNPELVDDDVTGALVPVGDRQAMASAIRTYVHDPALRARHGAAGRTRAHEQFALDRMAARYLGLYHELVSGKAA
jgi:sugar transferase (PEP-CTERM/EpsH1 system associated)